MKRKLMPPFLMLSAGAISSIIMYILHYETKSMLTILLGVLISFYIVGNLFVFMLNIFDRQNEETAAEEEEKTEVMSGDEEEGQVKTAG